MQLLYLSESLEKAMIEGQFASIKTELKKMHPNDLAEWMADLNTTECAFAFRLLDKDLAAETFAEMDFSSRKYLLESITDKETLSLVEALQTDEAVDLLEELPATVVSRVLGQVPHERRALLNRYLNYPKDSAGSIMTAEFLRVDSQWTIAEAIARVRSLAGQKVNVDNVYVTDAFRVLEGVLPLRKLLAAEDSVLVEEQMQKNFIRVEAHVDRELVVALFQDYDLLALPVVDAEGRLVGIITVDDIMDVSEAEVSEDFSKMALVEPSEELYLKRGVFSHAKSRVTWLLILMISGMVNGSILTRYEHAFVALPILVSFIPMLTDTGGNAGSQSSTLIIRGMATGEIVFKDLWQVLKKELGISILVGLALAVVNLVRILIFDPGQPLVALTVSLALLFIVLLSKIVGSSLPLLAKKIGLDPAIMAAPLITTIVDAFGLMVYFSFAEVLLGI